jgi:hypothetical protein
LLVLSMKLHLMIFGVRMGITKYLATYYDPLTGSGGQVQVNGLSKKNADMQVRDHFFGLLPPPGDERRAELQVNLRETRLIAIEPGRRADG